MNFSFWNARTFRFADYTYELLQNDKADNAPNIIPHEWDEWFSFFASCKYKIATESSYFREKMWYLQMKELFDSIATQNAEIRTVAKSLLLLLK